MAPLRYAAKFDPFLSLDCAPTPSTLAQSKERKGSNFAIWQPWTSLSYFGWMTGFVVAHGRGAAREMVMGFLDFAKSAFLGQTWGESVFFEPLRDGGYREEVMENFHLCQGGPKTQILCAPR